MFVIATFAYTPLFNMFLLRTPTPTSTAPPAPSKRSVRLMFPLTLFVSIIIPSLLLVQAPELADTGLRRHLWLVLSQLLLETLEHGASARTRVAVLVRITTTAACIAYRLPIARDWFYAAMDTATQVPGTAASVNMVVAAANVLYWAFGLFGFLLCKCLPYHAHELVESQ